jgi:hypothetical protein
MNPSRNPAMQRYDELAAERDQGDRRSPNDRPRQLDGDREPPREAPRETGTRLATLSRPGRRGRPAEELRVTHDSYEGHDYLGARIWTQGSDGFWYPTQRGITVRRGEILDFIKGMVAGARAMGVDLHPAKPNGGDDGGASHAK